MRRRARALGVRGVRSRDCRRRLCFSTIECMFFLVSTVNSSWRAACIAADCRDFTRRVRRACVSCENWEASLTWFASYRCMCEHWQSV